MGKIAYTQAERYQMNKSMRLSFAIGFFMLILKCYAYFLTGSAAVLSDSVESIVHVFAVGFAAYSMWLSHKPADNDHTYGHDRITFFSAGFEGGLICVAACYIFYQSIHKIIYGSELQNLDLGALFMCIATISNGSLGFFLLKQGKHFHSIVLEADGKHILTDCITSLGVIVALILSRLTGWVYFDPLIALLIACNISWTGFKLLRNAFNGLMDRSEPGLDTSIRALLEEATQRYKVGFHNMRHRNAGNRLLIEVHLLFPSDMSISRAHELATLVEHQMERKFEKPTELVTHLEPLEGHDEIHTRLLGHRG